MTRTLVGLLVVVSSAAHAATLQVPATYSTIQAAIDASTHGDTVAISPGIYKEHINFLGKNIVVRGIAGRDATFIEATDFAEPIVSIENGETSGAVLEGLTIRYAVDAAGVYCYNSSPIIQWCTMSFNSEQGRGGQGIYCHTNSAAIIRYNLLHDNAAQYGGAIRVYRATRVSIHHNEMFGNWGNYGSAIWSSVSDTASIHHNLIHGNQTRAAVYFRSGPHVFFGNALVGNAAGLAFSNGPGPAYVVIKNNIITGSGGDAMGPLYTSTASASYNNFWNNEGGGFPGFEGISVDPMFEDPSSGDFSLQDSSPCIDAGDPDPEYNDPDGSRSDMGPGPMTGLPHVSYWPDCPFELPGDINLSGAITSAEIIFTVYYVFLSGGEPLPCPENGDVNCSGGVTAADILHFVNYVFGKQGLKQKGRGDPICINCRLLYYSGASCP